jgi:signal transduction histidine kinase
LVYSRPVTDLLTGLQVAIEAAFVLLVIAMVAEWLRHRDRRHAYLALALGSLALVVLISPALAAKGAYSQLVTDVTLVLFLLSGYALIMFRASFIPMRPVTRRAVTIGIVAVAVYGIAVQLPADPQQPHGPLQSLALGAVLLTWAICVLEPTLRLWGASLRLPAVEGARMRALSLGYMGLVAVILASTAAGSLSHDPSFVLVIDLVTLAIVPLLYVGFSPPAWLRRTWRQPEEDEFRKALHDLLEYSPDRATQARRAVEWAARLVGGAGALIVDADGSVLAAYGLSDGEARRVAAEGTIRHPKPDDKSGPMSRLVIPLSLHEGKSSMIIFAGPYTPMFGDDEVVRLYQYAGSITAGLDRVSLTERVAALEKAKTEFLNIASHELRGPITVIKGYLTMLEAGSLGALSAKAVSVLPLLIAKSDEVNAMIEQMIEVARLEDGRLALKKQLSDIVELTEITIQGIRPLLSGHELEMQKPPGPIPADVDPDRFQIVVRNLLSNAVKYSPPATVIGVRVAQQGEQAIMAVTDQGMGISPEDQPQLFTRFGRIKSTEHVSGTGLGLWLSREIARMHDGDLTVESIPGRGSTFTMQLPLSR